MDNQNLPDEINKKIKEKKLNYQGPHCCLTMDRGLLNDIDILYYNPKYREYGIKIPKTKRYLLIKYCMFCDKKLPTSLRLMWAEILKKKYNLIDPINQDKNKIPKEFLTDEWWKMYTSNHLEQLNDETRHCCLDMYKELFSDESLLYYSPKYREHGIKIPKSTAIIEINYCLFCGKELPKSVGNEWLNILEQEYGLEWPTTSDKKKVPQEFLTDEWWKKRNL